MPLLLLLCALCQAAGTQDPVRATAALSASRITVGVSTTLHITVETRGDAPDDIRMPTLSPDLEVLGTGDYSQIQISVPGGRTRVIRRDVILSARRPGIYRIPPVQVRVGGNVYFTTPLELIVDDAPLRPSGGDAFSTIGPRLTLWLQPDTVYVGQQVLMQVEAVFSDEMRLRQTRPPSFDPPSPNGFWVQDLPNPVVVSLRVVDGRTVEMQTFRRAYFPLSAGRFVFPRARLHYELRRGFLYAPESRQIESDSATLLVQPLPQAGRPARFSGAVGSFALRAGLAPRRVNLGDAATLELVIEGSGNVKALPEPRLPELAGVEVFSPSQDSRVDVQNVRIGGMKRFRWVVVPERAGTLVIPPIEYAFFDPAERKYQVLRTDTMRLEAVPIVAAAASDTALRPLRAAERGTPLGWTRTFAYTVLQAMPLLGLVLLAGARHRRERQPTPAELRTRVAQRIEALSALPADAAFLTELEHVLLRGVRQILGGDGEPSAQLRRTGAIAVANRLDALIAELRRLRYAPAERFQRDVLLREARAVLHELPLGRRRKRAGAVASCALIAAATAAAPGARADTAEWEAAVTAFEAHDYVTAANRFYAFARAHPRQPDAWYNHGLAAHRAGDRGRAVWAWLRAARLAPRDRDIAHNLDVAGAGAALAAVRPFDRLAATERLLLVSVAWWIFAAAVALHLLHRSRAAAWLALPALLLAAGVASGAAAQALRPVYVTPLRNGAQLLAAPNVRAESLGRLAPGSIARVRGRRIGFLLVAVDDVREAWVERGAVAAP
jgi:hypothetical protein